MDLIDAIANKPASKERDRTAAADAAAWLRDPQPRPRPQSLVELWTAEVERGEVCDPAPQDIAVE